MATFDYQSVIFYDRDGGSSNFSFTNDFLDQSGTLDDGDVDNTFESGDDFQFEITQAIKDAFPDITIPVGTTVTLDYFGTYEQDGITYVVLEYADNPDIGFIFSPEDADTSFDHLDKTIDVSEINQGDFTVCFAEGTMIATPAGERVVETLEIGDRILTADGREIGVKWIGQQTVSKQFTPETRFRPVRIRAGALGDGVPNADLTVTPDHALMIDGFAINASALVNGTSIDWVPMGQLADRVTYFHIETDTHDVVLANNTPAETFVDYVTRGRFDNFAEYRALYGDEDAITEMSTPRISAARLVPRTILDRIGKRAVA
ncbi:Hint domain-containing protein [Pseudoruegeria sp. SHC-113]|uniref:Hint domain-containing protein n=1 Tax=Pseudoruegeria sp. SHC-113 TaxID=2855439 RepID=UPI0021BB0993|nr:Hint domain-containing protein [Pseudoruegeria sp. SHC-113]MCT8162204.1 Hint domain-containing protein [Pseudoruegeria sp. SHC-113]